MFIWYSQIDENAGKSKFAYNGRGIAFDGKDMWSYSNDFSRCVVIFVVDNTSSFHTNNQKNTFLILGEQPTEDINDSVGAGEKKLALTLIKQRQDFVSVCITKV